MKLKRTIILTIILALILVGTGLSVSQVIRNKLRNSLINNYANQEQVIGKGVASTLEFKVQNIETTLEALSLDPSVEGANPATCNQALQRAAANLAIGVGNLGRVNAQDTFYCSINPKLVGLPASKLGPYVQQLINDPLHRPVVSRELVVPGVTGYVVAIHVPVYNLNHQFIGTLGGGIYLNQLAVSYLNTIKFAKTGYAGMQDDNGDILYTHIKKYVGKNFFSSQIQNSPGDLKQIDTAILAARKGKTSSVRYTNYLGIKKVAAVVPVNIVPGHRWIITVNVPVSEASAVFVNTGLDKAFDIFAAIYALSVFLIAGLLIANSVRSARLQKAEDQFVSLVSHQLRTPLTSIRLFSEMLTNGVPGRLNAKQDDYVDKIHISTVRMIRLVSDILNVSHVSLNRLKVVPEPTDVKQLIGDIVEEATPLAKERGVGIKTNLPTAAVIVSLDPTLARQIVHNLVTNAIRYSKETKGLVTVSLGKQAGSWRIDVADNGIGIPASARKKIFRQYFRADNAVAHIGEGTGLGLYMVKMIAQETGCNITFESTEGQGSTFSFAIPIKGISAKNGDRKLL